MGHWENTPVHAKTCNELKIYHMLIGRASFLADQGHPNPPLSSGFFIGINWFGDIPDHQQSVRCKAYFGRKAQGARRTKESKLQKPWALYREPVERQMDFLRSRQR